jgi:hypothetical protein
MNMGAYFTVLNQSLLFRRRAAGLEGHTKDQGQPAQTLLALEQDIKAISLAPNRAYRIGN